MKHCESPGCTFLAVRKRGSRIRVLCEQHDRKPLPPPAEPPPPARDADWSFLGPRDLGRFV